MGNYSKDDIKKLKPVYTDVSKLDNEIGSIVSKKQELEEKIRSIYRTLQQEKAIHMLGEMDIENLNIDKEGIRISALRNASIQNVGQLYGKTSAQIQQINGIGEAMADKIVTNTNALLEQCVDNARVVLSLDDKSSSMTNMVKALGDLLSKQESFLQAEKLYEHHKDIEKNKNAKLLNTSLRWAFASKSKKEEAIESAKGLEQLLQSGYKDQAQLVIKEYNQASRKLIVNPWKDFEANVSAYTILLENIIEGGSGSIDEASARRNINALTGGGTLQDELIQSISDFELDLHLLKATLRRYQVFGTKYILHQEKVLLGDEMGLGKTMQAIASFCHLKATGEDHFLVVCPLSVVVNWTREIQANSELSVIEVYGEGRDEEMLLWQQQGGVAITTYETLNRVPVPEDLNISMMVVDEAHYIKNPSAQRTQSVVKAMANARRVLLMSGTPLENRIEEMQFLIQCLRTDIYDTIKNMKQLSSAKAFREKIAPVYLRRVREDVLKELPELIEKEQWGIMNKEENKEYEISLLSDNFMKARQVSFDVADIHMSTKAARLLEICEEAKESERKVIIFSFFKNTLNQVASLLGEDCVGIIDGSISSGKRQEMIDSLKSAPAGACLVSQIQAGGVGLNIQTASVIIFCEPQMKPSLETQAIARAYRMGQARSVLVHRLLLKNSVDEQIMELLCKKTEVFNQFADESVIGGMDEAIKTDDIENVDEKNVASKIMDAECERRGLVRGEQAMQ